MHLQKTYRFLCFLWLTAFLSYLSYLGYRFYEIEKEAALIESIGKRGAREAAISYDLSDAVISFEVEGDVKDSVKEYAASYYLAIPKTLRDTFAKDGWKIILTKKDIAKAYYDGPVKGRLAGLTDYKEKTIYVHGKKTDVRRALIHEFGHYIDYRFGGISYTDSFKQTYQSEKNLLNEKWKIDSHITSNPQEYFAESISQFLIYPAQSKRQTPRTYETIKELLAVF